MSFQHEAGEEWKELKGYASVEPEMQVWKRWKPTVAWRIVRADKGTVSYQTPESISSETYADKHFRIALANTELIVHQMRASARRKEAVGPSQ